MAEGVTTQAPAIGARFVAARIIHQVAVHARRDERAPEADWLDRLSMEVRRGEPATWELTRALAPTREKTGAGHDRD